MPPFSGTSFVIVFLALLCCCVTLGTTALVNRGRLSFHSYSTTSPMMSPLRHTDPRNHFTGVSRLAPTLYPNLSTTNIVCEPLTVGFCSGLAYTSTVRQGVAGSEFQHQAVEFLQLNFGRMLHARCGTRMRLIACASVLPPCFERAVLPSSGTVETTATSLPTNETVTSRYVDLPVCASECRRLRIRCRTSLRYRTAWGLDELDCRRYAHQPVGECVDMRGRRRTDVVTVPRMVDESVDSANESTIPVSELSNSDSELTEVTSESTNSTATARIWHGQRSDHLLERVFNVSRSVRRHFVEVHRVSGRGEFYAVVLACLTLICSLLLRLLICRSGRSVPKPLSPLIVVVVGGVMCLLLMLCIPNSYTIAWHVAPTHNLSTLVTDGEYALNETSSLNRTDDDDELVLYV